jgi:uncharacterized protein (TIGR02246 family)
MSSAHAAVADVLHRYCYAVDDGDAAAVAAVFAEDGELDVGNGVVIAGRDALLAFFERRLAQYDASSHHLSNIRVSDVDGRARATSYVYARIWPVGGGDGGELWARYLDDLVEDGGRGSISRRSLRAAGWRGFPAFADQPAQFERYVRSS